MPTVRVKPNGSTIQNGINLTGDIVPGGSTVHAVLSDGSDSSYVKLDTANDVFRVGRNWVGGDEEHCSQAYDCSRNNYRAHSGTQLDVPN